SSDVCSSDLLCCLFSRFLDDGHDICWKFHCAPSWPIAKITKFVYNRLVFRGPRKRLSFFVGLIAAEPCKALLLAVKFFDPGIPCHIIDANPAVAIPPVE